jgi:hypothetical protein
VAEAPLIGRSLAEMLCVETTLYVIAKGIGGLLLIRVKARQG